MSSRQAVAAAFCTFACVQLSSAQFTDILSTHTLRRAAGLLTTYGRPPLIFDANRGQTDPAVAYLTRTPGYTLFLTREGPVVERKSGCTKPYGIVRAHSAAGRQHDGAAISSGEQLAVDRILCEGYDCSR
jgi:hypothetical protein